MVWFESFLVVLVVVLSLRYWGKKKWKNSPPGNIKNKIILICYLYSQIRK